jgi:aryl-alcohol dehydrogenase-like predicted oxidoreductase
MKYKQICGTDLKTSVLCLGTGGFGTVVSKKESHKQLDFFFEHGGNFIDTARVYSDWVPGETGRVEKILGRYLKEKNSRKLWVVCTKGGHPLLSSMEVPRLSREELTKDIELSLKDMQIDYVDIYLLHRDDVNVGVDEIIDLLNEFVAAGKIRYFGCSNWTLQRVQEAQEYAENCGKAGFCCNQLLWNIGSSSITCPKDIVVMDKDMLRFCRKTKFTIMPYSCQAGGFFSKLCGDKISRARALQTDYATGKNLSLYSTIQSLGLKYKVPISHIVVSYLISRPETVIPVFSSSKLDTIEDTVNGVELEICASDIRLIESLNNFA